MPPNHHHLINSLLCFLQYINLHLIYFHTTTHLPLLLLLLLPPIFLSWARCGSIVALGGFVLAVALAAQAVDLLLQA